MRSLFQKGNNRAVEAVEDVLQLVTFRVGEQECGLDITSVSEVIRPLKITPLPRMPRFIEGVINLRGIIIPVVDLRKRFVVGNPGADTRKVRMMITRGAIRETGGGDLLALIVDGADEVITVPKKDIAPPPEAARGAQTDFIGGVGKTEDRLIIILDIAKVLSRQERNDLAEANHAEP